MPPGLRILHVCPYFHPVVGGMENVILQLSTAMAHRGHDVTVFTSDLNRSGRITPRSEYISGVRVLRFPAWLRLGSFASLWPTFCLQIRPGRFDVVHVHSYRHPHCELASLRMFRGTARLVLQPHWPGHPRGRWTGALLKAYDGALGRRLLQACDLVFALTPREVPWLRARGAKRVAVLPNGIPARWLGQRADRPTVIRPGGARLSVVSVGRIDRMKGFHFVAEALHRVDGVHYTIVGPPGDGMPALARLIHQARLEQRITLTGELPPEQVRDALDTSDVFIQPSLFESFGVSALEALARGIPCLGSSAGGLGALLDGCGLLFEPGDVQGIADALCRVRDDEDLRTALGAAGRDRAAAFTWDRIIPTYEQRLAELM